MYFPTEVLIESYVCFCSFFFKHDFVEDMFIPHEHIIIYIYVYIYTYIYICIMFIFCSIIRIFPASSPVFQSQGQAFMIVKQIDSRCRPAGFERWNQPGATENAP